MRIDNLERENMLERYGGEKAVSQSVKTVLHIPCPKEHFFSPSKCLQQYCKIRSESTRKIRKKGYVENRLELSTEGGMGINVEI